jgi:hypothetical protein
MNLDAFGSLLLALLVVGCTSPNEPKAAGPCAPLEQDTTRLHTSEWTAEIQVVDCWVIIP